jgi:hypothetical protein
MSSSWIRIFVAFWIAAGAWRNGPTAGRPGFGKVVDEAGRPVAGAEVRLLPAEGAGGSDRELRSGDAVRATSDKKGRFTIATLPAGRVDLDARAPGYVSTFIRGLTVAPGPGAFDLGRVILASGSRLEGWVEDPEGQPVEGAVVRAGKADPTTARLAMAGVAVPDPEAVTGADGRFEIRGLRPGDTVRLAVSRQGYASRGVPGLRVPAEEPVRVVLSPASRVSGRVVDEAGAPVAMAQVVLRPGGQAITGLAIAGLGRADGEGKFSLENVEAGRFALAASAQGYIPTQKDGIEVVAGADVDGLEVVLRRGAVVEGTVSTPDGNPLSGVRVQSFPPPGDDAALLAVVPETLTDGDGHYHLAGLRTGRQSLVAEHPGYPRAAREVDVRDEETRVDLRLGRSWEVAGRAVDTRGRGIAGVRIELTSAVDASIHETVSGAEGSFRIPGVGEGRHRLRAAKEGYAPPPLQEIQIAGPVRDLELRLDGGAAVSGQIRGLSSQDLAHVHLVATRTGVPGEQEGRADSQGSYRIDDLAAGDWLVLARMPDGRMAQGQVTIASGARAVALDLEFAGGVTLSGRVLAGASPIAGAVVRVLAGDGSGAGGGVSGPQGEFRIEGLRPGIYAMTVVPPQPGSPHNETLELPGDREVVIDLAPRPAAR